LKAVIAVAVVVVMAVLVVVAGMLTRLTMHDTKAKAKWSVQRPTLRPCTRPRSAAVRPRPSLQFATTVTKRITTIIYDRNFLKLS